MILLSTILFIVAFFSAYYITSYVLRNQYGKEVSKDKMMEYRLMIKFNLQTPELLKEMASTNNAVCQMRIFACDNIPGDILYLLHNSKFDEIRAKVAKQDNIPKDIAIALSKDRCSHVRQALGYNRNVDNSIKIGMLADCSDAYVWDAVVDSVGKEDVSRFFNKDMIAYRG